MNLTSTAFTHNGIIPRVYTCEGGDRQPQLEISDPPPEAKSFALLVRDPDAPSGDFVHWLMWNIDPMTEKIEEGTEAAGMIEGTNDFQKIGWGGPCPPSGMHRYEFHLYALDTMLDLPPSTTKEDFRNAIKGHILEESVLIGLYKMMG